MLLTIKSKKRKRQNIDKLDIAKYSCLIYSVKFLIVILFGVTIAASSCTPIVPVDTSLITYQTNEPNPSEFYRYKVGILPVLAGEGYEGFRRTTADAVYDAIINRYKDISLKSAQETRTIINDANLTDDYSKLITDYSTSGIIHKNILNTIADELDVDFLLSCKVGYNASIHETLSIYSYRNYQEVSEIDIYTQLWNPLNGDIVWEGTGGCAHDKNDLNILIPCASKGLAIIIGKNSKDVPPAQTREAVIMQISKNTTAQVWGYVIGSFALSLLLLSI